MFPKTPIESGPNLAKEASKIVLFAGNYWYDDIEAALSLSFVSLHA